MKKVFLISTVLFFSSWFFIGCSNEEQFETSTEMQVENLKQKFRYYASKYGVTNIFFNNEMLSKHLDMTDNEIEKRIIHIAIWQGVLDADAGSLRNKFRTRSINNNEGGGSGTLFSEAKGSFTESKNIGDSLYFSYTIDFMHDHAGYTSLKANPRDINVNRKYKCDSPSCNLWHDDFDVYTATISAVSPDGVDAGITAENGYSVPFDITYTITIDGNNISFHYYHTETFLGAIGIVTSWIE